MKAIFGTLVLLLAFASCVPAKKYNDLVEREKKCSEDLAKFKTDALNYEADAKTLREKSEILGKEVSILKKDTAAIGHKYRTLLAKYDRIAQINEALETNYDKLRLTGAQETATLTSDLQAKRSELQKREDELLALEKELRTKETLLNEREARVTELEELIKRKDEATAALKHKVAEALKGFANKGLSVEERNGKIYVSLEAKLLFASGSTIVEKEGQEALIELAKVLEGEKELEIIVEGHTDTDKLNSSRHPKSNWELSVLRATSVIEILLSNSSMDPKQLMAAGRSEFHPVDEADKAKNRRIE
ncbi:Motility protein B, partial [Exaiptasia diaphana]